MAKKRDIGRFKAKKRNRGMPMFEQKESTPKDMPKLDLVMEPETSMDVARLLADEIKKKWPNATIPTTISGKHTKLTRDVMAEFDAETVKKMVRVLVWDFEEIKKNKAFFPPSSHLNTPWLD